MDEPRNWDTFYTQYLEYWRQWRAFVENFRQWRPTNPRAPRFEPSPMALGCLSDPTDDDVRWLRQALIDATPAPLGRRWFVAALFRHSDDWADVLFTLVLDAGIDEVDPSLNRLFVEPCVTRFGTRRVEEYLLYVIEADSDVRKSGAVNALYWSGTPVRGGSVSVTPELPAEYEARKELRDRTNRILLETFVSNADVDVRRSVIRRLTFDRRWYPESHWPLIAEAIDIARAHKDPYIRHRMEVQLGDYRGGFAALPRRGSRTD